MGLDVSCCFCLFVFCFFFVSVLRACEEGPDPDARVLEVIHEVLQVAACIGMKLTCQVVVSS